MSNNQCVSKCIDPDKFGFNPIYLNFKKEKTPFCFDNVLDKFSTSNCDMIKSKENYLIPQLNFSEQLILKIVYEITNWNECLNYCKKYKKTINKNTLKRIIKFSWISFITSYKVNLDKIIDIYQIYVDINNLNYNRKIISESLHSVKKMNSDPLLISSNLFDMFQN